jgi:uncharacterized membrane protein YeiH
MQSRSTKLLYAVDLAGTLLFAFEGASAGVQDELDILGLTVLAFATAMGGGIIRDVLIGSVPPNALRDWRYSVMAMCGAAALFLFYPFVGQMPPTPLMILDAAGLSLFVVSGTGKALQHELPPLNAILLGAITGVGGGTIRDVLLAKIPTVLWADVYATSALIGATTMVISRKLKLPPVPSAILGGSVCFALRVVGALRHWNLPWVH